MTFDSPYKDREITRFFLLKQELRVVLSFREGSYNTHTHYIYRAGERAALFLKLWVEPDMMIISHIMSPWSPGNQQLRRRKFI